MKLLVVTWGPDAPPDPRPVKLRRSWLPHLLGHDSFVLGRTIRTRLATMSDGHIRHELVHVKQQAELGVCRFLWRYYLRGQRRAIEAEAARAHTAAWPQWSALG